MKLILATQNQGKVREMITAIGSRFEVLGLPEELANEEIPETENTLEANAFQKARYVFERTGILSVADDTGLEVEALDGRPGVFSARYAGLEKSSEANMKKLLEELDGVTDRKARFRTSIAVVGDGVEESFEGIVNGTIRNERSGVEGFGYDPVFQPDGYEITFAEMTAEEKGRISHRGRALRALIAHFS